METPGSSPKPASESWWRKAINFPIAVTVIYLVGFAVEHLVSPEWREKAKPLDRAFYEAVEKVSPFEVSRIFYGSIWNGSSVNLPRSKGPARDNGMRVVFGWITPGDRRDVIPNNLGQPWIPSDRHPSDPHALMVGDVGLTLDDQTIIATQKSSQMGACCFLCPIGGVPDETPAKVDVHAYPLHRAAVAYATEAHRKLAREVVIELESGKEEACGEALDVMAYRERKLELKYQVSVTEEHPIRVPPRDRWDPSRIVDAVFHTLEVTALAGPVSFITAIIAMTFGVFFVRVTEIAETNNSFVKVLTYLLVVPVAGSSLVWVLVLVMQLSAYLFGAFLYTADLLAAVSTMPLFGGVLVAVGKEREHSFTGKLIKKVEAASTKWIEKVLRVRLH